MYIYIYINIYKEKPLSLFFFERSKATKSLGWKRTTACTLFFNLSKMTFELIQVGKFALFVDDDDPYNKGVKVSWYIVFPFGLKLALAIAFNGFPTCIARQ
jgi:hypothetical protein